MSPSPDPLWSDQRTLKRLNILLHFLGNRVSGVGCRAGYPTPDTRHPTPYSQKPHVTQAGPGSRGVARVDDEAGFACDALVIEIAMVRDDHRAIVLAQRFGRRLLVREQVIAHGQGWDIRIGIGDARAP